MPRYFSMDTPVSAEISARAVTQLPRIRKTWCRAIRYPCQCELLSMSELSFGRAALHRFCHQTIGHLHDFLKTPNVIGQASHQTVESYLAQRTRMRGAPAKN